MAKEGWPFVGGTAGIIWAAGLVCFVSGQTKAAWILGIAGLVGAVLMGLFFRNPTRSIPQGPGIFVSGADGVVANIQEIHEKKYIQGPTVRISVFLSIFDVHMNRTPIKGRVLGVDYSPGRKLFAFLNAASDENEQSSIFIQGEETQCLVKQIVGPVARRVVTWLQPGQEIQRGEVIGLMKFGSRLDIYFPLDEVTVLIKKGDRVKGGETVVATLKGG